VYSLRRSPALIEIKTINNEKNNRLIDIFAGDALIASILKFFYRKYLPFPSFFDNLTEAKKWFQELEKKRTKSYLLYLLSKRNYHSSELRLKLKEKFISDQTIEKMLKEINLYLDDKRWTRLKIEKEFAKGYGPRVLKAKFFDKGIQIKPEEMENILTRARQKEKLIFLLTKLLKRGFDQKKILSNLARRGFDYELVKEALSTFHLGETLLENEL
jgi:SOS response regulatory protein OraA/RecX